MDDIWLAYHHDMGRQRYEGKPGTGPFGAVLADDPLLTIKDNRGLFAARVSPVGSLFCQIPHSQGSRPSWPVPCPTCGC
ncbi:hypothetical protein MTO96_013687 [Rhipicephalus appendiculatus]